MSLETHFLITDIWHQKIRDVFPCFPIFHRNALVCSAHFLSLSQIYSWNIDGFQFWPIKHRDKYAILKRGNGENMRKSSISRGCPAPTKLGPGSSALPRRAGSRTWRPGRPSAERQCSPCDTSRCDGWRVPLLGGELPTDRKWVATLVINGISGGNVHL